MVQICIVYAENGYGLAACGWWLFIDYRGFSGVEKVKSEIKIREKSGRASI